MGGGLRSAVGRRPGDPLGPEDLERLATAAYLIGRDADSDELLTRAHHGFLRQGEVERAARCAFWLGFLLLLRAEPARSGGWLARARGLLDDGLRDCVEQGLLLVLVARQHLSEGDAATACATSDKATTAERELLPVAEAFGLSVCGWAPMGAGILTGKYTAGGSALPDDSRRAAANQARLTERNLAIAREVDRIAESLGATSAQVAVAWVRSRGVIPILGVRKAEQLKDTLSTLELQLPATQLARLDEVSRTELGFPYELLRGPQGQMVYGDLEPRIELPATAPIRWQ